MPIPTEGRIVDNAGGMKYPTRLLPRICAMVIALAMPFHVFAQTTAFSYQGRLNENSAPADGQYDFQFTVYPTANGGAPVSAPFAANGVLVTNGLFTVMLDFGDGVFTGPPRWLQIEVKKGIAPGPLVPLSPRQPITAAPYALYAARANQAATVPWIGLTGVTLGAGVSLGASNSIGVRFGNTPDTAAPGDHTHFAQEWSGAVGGLYGLRVNNAGAGGGGIFGHASAATGLSIGLRGDSDSVGGMGVFGRATAASGNTFGVQGMALSPGGTGVAGFHQALSGTAPGVEGETASTSGNAAGVIGRVSALAAGGFSAGVRGINQSTNGSGIGVYGSQNGSGWGVHGTSPRGVGVFGTSTSGDGVVGSSTSGDGVVGSSTTGAALSASGNGVIRSTAETHIFIPANTFRLFFSKDGVENNLNLDGTMTYQGTSDEPVLFNWANVYVPMVLPAVLYGQNITLKRLTIFYHNASSSNGINIVRVARPTAPGASEVLIEDNTLHNSTTASYTSFTLNFPQATTLSHDLGILGCYIHVNLEDYNAPVTLAGVRLTISHE